MPYPWEVSTTCTLVQTQLAICSFVSWFNYHFSPSNFVFLYLIGVQVELINERQFFFGNITEVSLR